MQLDAKYKNSWTTDLSSVSIAKITKHRPNKPPGFPVIRLEIKIPESFLVPFRATLELQNNKDLTPIVSVVQEQENEETTEE